MPNWCKNVLKVSGDTEQMLRFREDLRLDDGLLTIKGKCFGRGELTSEDGSSVGYWFESPWAPPVDLLKETSADYSLLVFKTNYMEPLQGFAGTVVFSSGEIIEHEHESFDSREELCDSVNDDDGFPLKLEIHQYVAPEAAEAGVTDEEVPFDDGEDEDYVEW